MSIKVNVRICNNGVTIAGIGKKHIIINGNKSIITTLYKRNTLT